MPGDYTKQTAKALATLKAKGKSVLLKRPPEAGGVDPVTQEITGTTKSYSTYGIQLPLNLGTKDVEVPAHVRTSRLAKFLLPGSLTIEPQSSDLVVMSSVEWQVFAVTTLAPVGKPVLHTVYCYR
jgi:hypothetical protein